MEAPTPVTYAAATSGAQAGLFGPSASGVGDVRLALTYAPTASGQTWTGTIEVTLDGTNWAPAVGTISYTSTGSSPVTEISSNLLAGPVQDVRINWSACPQPVTVAARRA